MVIARPVGEMLLAQHQPRLALVAVEKALLVGSGDKHPKSRGRNDENPLSSCPCRIGNQLCIAHLCRTNKHARSTAAPKACRHYCKTCRCDKQERCRRGFTQDAVFVTNRGPVKGREAIEKWYAILLNTML